MVPNPHTYLIQQYRHKEFMEARTIVPTCWGFPTIDINCVSTSNIDSTSEGSVATEFINSAQSTALVDRLQDNGRELLVNNLRLQQQFQRTLNGEDVERYALLHQRVTQQLQAQFTHERQLGIPREFQPRIPNNYQLPVVPHPVNLGPEDNVDLAPEAFVTSTAPPILQSKKSHGSTRSRALTGVEVAERFSKRQRKCRVQKAATGNSREMGVEGVPVQETQDIIILNPRSC
ncbi:hypothetical protein EV426DRAFT_678218 [Tirmania nivea]|nr:hypothetical protein EV426DRAFT_678218 [Tirmania nivea]